MLGRYTHIQNTPSSLWTVSHNLEVESASVEVSINTSQGLQIILPVNISKIDNNTLSVSFTENQTGIVTVVGI